MKAINEFLEAIGLNITLLIAGTIGSFIGMKKNQPLWIQILTLFTGAFIANYTAPVVVSLFGLEPNTLGGIGFVCGYSGKHMLEYVIDKLKKK